LCACPNILSALLSKFPSYKSNNINEAHQFQVTNVSVNIICKHLT
jgi:hypothetical protein